MIVDHDCGGVEAVGRMERDLDVLGEDARLKSDRKRVRDSDCVIEIGIAVDASEWAKYLFSRDPGIERRFYKNRWHKRCLVQAPPVDRAGALGQHRAVAEDRCAFASYAVAR